jgi:hypothetical protein
MKRASIACVVALGLVLGSGGAAMAGEVNGNGEDIPGAGNAASLCAFSGQDTPDAIENPPNAPGYNPMFDDDAVGMRGPQKNGFRSVQSYGAFVKAGAKAFLPSPGVACNPTKGFEE